MTGNESGDRQDWQELAADVPNMGERRMLGAMPPTADPALLLLRAGWLLADHNAWGREQRGKQAGTALNYESALQAVIAANDAAVTRWATEFTPPTPNYTYESNG